MLKATRTHPILAPKRSRATTATIRSRILASLLVILFVHAGHGQTDSVEPMPVEARTALEFLNSVRANPSAFSAEVKVDLGRAPRSRPLVWDDRLAASAQEKAEDMARRDYVGHFSPEGVGPGELARKHGYYLPLSWPDSSDFNYIESVSAGSSRLAREHIKNLLFDRGVPDSSPQANHRKHLLGMNKFWAAHVHVGMGFAYNPRTKFKGYFVVHTGVPGVPFVTVSGTLYAPDRVPATVAIPDIWVGGLADDKMKFWTQVSIARGAASVPYRVRVPQNTRLRFRYFKQYSPRRFARGYYSAAGTVATESAAPWIATKAEDIHGVDLVFRPPE